jgi:tryptophanyl-tRNA synthetase
LLTGSTKSDVIDEWKGKTQYGELKKAVSNEVEKFLNEFQMKKDSYSEKEVLEILEKGEQHATLIAADTLKKVQKAVGLR